MYTLDPKYIANKSKKPGMTYTTVPGSQQIIDPYAMPQTQPSAAGHSSKPSTKWKKNKITMLNTGK